MFVFLKKASWYIYIRFCAIVQYIFFSIQKWYRSIKYKKIYNRLIEFKDLYKGKRVFLIGTGPSLTEEDVLALKNEYTFSVNSFAVAAKDLQFEPTFYGFIDGQAMDAWSEEILSIEKSKIFYTCKRPLKGCYLKALRKKENAYEFLQKDDGCWVAFAKHIPQGFSRDIYKEVYWGYTCVYSMMQIIAYMGFAEVYLLGMDCIYAPGARNFRDARDEETIKKGSYGGKTVPGFIKAWEAVEEYTRDMDIKIYNATRGGMLEVFERVDLDDVLQKNT